MDTHTRSAQDLLPSGGQSFDTDELEHETATERSAHPPSEVQSSGHAEKDIETASLPFGDSHEPATAQPLTMPGEHEMEAHDPSSPAAPVSVTKPSTRNLLLGTALGLALMVGGGSAYILSHRGHVVQMAAMPPPAWHPEQVTRNAADPVGALTANPFPAPPNPTQPAPDGADDILAMRHTNAAQPAAAAVSAPKASPPAVVAHAAPVIVAPPPAATAATSAPADPVAVALVLRPAPMAPQQLVDVLSLVTQLAALVRDMRTENAQLRDKVASLDDILRNETSDVSQRLSLMEARKAIASAQDAGKSQASALSGGEAAVPPKVVQSVAVVPVAVRSVRDYRVQAASPGLAILASADAAPGQSAGLQVSVGDQVPGVGRITSIAQRGTAWVVQTNHGAIQ